MQPIQININIPAWVSEYTSHYENTSSVTERMKFVIGAAHENVTRKTGGPFAAAIFETDSGKLVSLGVNLVTREGISTLHAEMVAIMLAQKALNTFDLGAKDLPDHQLITSAEPCAMCFGAIPWSGVTSVVAGAKDVDVREIGFDEGPKPESWSQELQKRGISVQEEVLRDSVKDVFRNYRESGGEVYNSRAKQN